MNINSPKYLENYRKRNTIIFNMRKDGKTLEEIGNIFKIRKQRVKQILDRIEKKLSTSKGLTA